MKISFNSRYCETDCTFCDRRIHTANLWLPSWVSELIGGIRFWLHRHTAAHTRLERNENATHSSSRLNGGGAGADRRRM